MIQDRLSDENGVIKDKYRINGVIEGLEEFTPTKYVQIKVPM